MDQEAVNMIKTIMDTQQIGFAYLYPKNGGERLEYMLATTPENLANFIGSHVYDAEKMVVTDIADNLILNTSGGFINRCPNQALCREILKHLTTIQMGDCEAGQILAVDWAQADEYWEMEEAAATMAEQCMG